MKLYNTLSNQIEDFKPIELNKIKMYACGPTVYNYIHIGNARMPVIFDVLRNFFKYQNFEVIYVQNYTDIDDKIIQQAKIMNITEQEVAEKFIAAYEENMQGLYIKKPDVTPKVTEHIKDIINFIQNLIHKGFAYEVDGNVYFKVNKYKEYGQLSNQSTNELTHGVRVHIHDNKEDSTDFALWKNTNEDGLVWDSPWGKGRPGWHIECSVMANEHLGTTIDIHGGGIDLCFPHHENELAQSHSHNDQPLANFWMHNGHITIDGRKMSKSLGNVVLVKDALQKYSGETIRFFFLNTYYRNPIDYTEEVLNQSKNSLEKIKNTVLRLKNALSFSSDDSISEEVLNYVLLIKDRFFSSLDNDFNTPEAITSLFMLSKKANLLLDHQNINKSEVELLLNTFYTFDHILSFNLNVQEEILDSEIEQMITNRNLARQNKNYALSDEIRNKLKEKGIYLEDTPNGTVWTKK